MNEFGDKLLHELNKEIVDVGSQHSSFSVSLHQFSKLFVVCI